MVSNSINMHYKKEDFDKLPKRFRTKLINGLSGFKSVNLVGTQDQNGMTNLAIHSSMVHLGANPPYMGFVMRPISVKRDTYNNIMDLGYYTFNHIHEGIFEQAHQTSGRYTKEQSEFDVTGLTPEYKDGFTAPFVKESVIQIGMRFVEKIDIKINNTILIVGAIESIYAPEGIIQEDGYVDYVKGANVAGFVKVAEAMMAQGVV